MLSTSDNLHDVDLKLWSMIFTFIVFCWLWEVPQCSTAPKTETCTTWKHVICEWHFTHLWLLSFVTTKIHIYILEFCYSFTFIKKQDMKVPNTLSVFSSFNMSVSGSAAVFTSVSSFNWLLILFHHQWAVDPFSLNSHDVTGSAFKEIMSPGWHSIKKKSVFLTL